MKSTLDQLRTMTTVVADTGDLNAVRKFHPTDCTTNPSLVFSALSDPSCADLVARELRKCKAEGLGTEHAAATLTVAIGTELASAVPGRVSTEVDASLSFDTGATIQRGMEIIQDYADRGIGRERILIKIAATWEGIQAAGALQREGVDSNVTLLFAMPQAVACAQAGVFLISPFVGRITDWFKASEAVEAYPVEDDPGVLSVRRIYDLYKSNKIETIIMGASFRTVDQVKALAGCDNLTISPTLLEELSQSEAYLPRKLVPQTVSKSGKIQITESEFRWAMNENAMAVDKLAEGIRNFHADHSRLMNLLEQKMEDIQLSGIS